MKKSKKNLIILALLALLISAGAVQGYLYWRNRDERLLRALVSELEDMAAKRPGKSNALALLDAATPERVFAEKIQVSSDLPKVQRSFTLKETGQLFVMMKKSCSTTGLEISIDRITVSKEQAEIAGELIFSASRTDGGRIRELRKTTLQCEKIKGKWKISGAEFEAVIKK